MNTQAVSLSRVPRFACARPQGSLAVIVSVLLLLLVLPSSSQAATYYLNPGTAAGGWNAGVDTNNGTSINTPWKTMFKVKSSVTAGDIVNVKGGTYTATQYKGEGSTPIWNQTHGAGVAGNPIIIQTNPGDTQAVFDGEFTVYWMLFRNDSGTNGHYIIIRNLTFHHYSGIAIGFNTNGASTLHHVAVVNCIFQNFTSNQSGASGTMSAHHVIYKNNQFVNIGDKALGGDNFPDSQHALYLNHHTNNLVIDGNYIEKISGFGVVGYGAGTAGSTSDSWIVRRNTIVNTWSSSIAFSADTYSNLYTYHNTLYNEQIPFPIWGTNANCSNSQSHCSMLTTHGGGGYTNLVAVNNIGLGYETQASVWADVVTPFTFAVMDYNLWYNQLTTTSVYKWNNTLYTLAGFRTATPGTQADHDINNFPNFVDVPSRNFALQNTSPARNAGTVLTTAVGAGTASTSLTVGDAKYFYDGYGIHSSLPGDTIQVGNATTTITGISGNVLTISPAISWTNGAAVSLPYNGSAPDMGAFESAEPATQLAFSTQPGTASAGFTMSPVVVQGLTAGAVLDATFVGTVTLSLVGSGGLLTGTLSQAAVAGQATFGNLVVSAPGTYTLHAVSGSLTAADSVSFVITTPVPSTTGGIALDGLDDYLTAGTSTAYQCANATCTVMGWFRSNGDDGYIFAKRSLAGDMGGFFLRVDTAGTLTGRTYDNGGAPVIQKATSSTTAKNGQWHCFGMVFTTVTSGAAGNDLTLYYDGVLDTVSAGSGSGLGYDNTNNPLVFGALSDFDSSGWLNGGVDDVRFYTSGLSPENIARYCSAQIKFGGFTFGTLLSYWPMNQCAEGASGDAVAFADVNKGGSALTGVDGANNTGVTCHGTNRMTYPASVQ